MGGVGLDFNDVARRLGSLCPEVADFEEPRWNALAHLQQLYRQQLTQWGYSDATDALRKRLAEGVAKKDGRILACFVADYSPLFIPFFEKVQPAIAVVAPSSHAAGFGAYGKLITSYWLEHPVSLDSATIIPCERSEDQAEEIAHLVSSLEVFLPSSFSLSDSISIATPDVSAVPMIREQLALADIKARWAGGKSFKGSRLHQLLHAVATMMDSFPKLSLEAFRLLLRHPDINVHLSDQEKVDFFRNSTSAVNCGVAPVLEVSSSSCTLNFSAPSTPCTSSAEASLGRSLLIRQLDQWEQDHLSQFLEKDHLRQFPKFFSLLSAITKIEEIIGFSPRSQRLDYLVNELRLFFLRTMGDREVRVTVPEEHYLVGCLEKLNILLEEISCSSSASATMNIGSETGSKRKSDSGPFSLRMADFIRLLIEIMSSEELPEREEPEAIELLGWLEVASDDAPVIIISSCHEGALPSSQRGDPWLPEGIRGALGLPDNKRLLARDHYLLHTIMAARTEAGVVKIFAPRHNGRGEPVRPSRLLMLGCSEEELPERVLSLTQRLQGGSYRSQSQQDFSKNLSSQSTEAAMGFVTPVLESSGMPYTFRALRSEVPCPSSASATLKTGSKQESSFRALPITEATIERLNVTSLRTYLRSPRLFYLQHILKLQEIELNAVEMDASQFGTLIHAVLGAFGAEEKITSVLDAKETSSWFRKKLFEIAQYQFGNEPRQSIVSQIEEVMPTLDGFAKAQQLHRSKGWKIIHAEAIDQGGGSRLEKMISLPKGQSVILQGRIDRVDWHPETRRWLIIDYKTSNRQDWERQTPDREHFQEQGGVMLWHDLQLPLYLKLVDQIPAVMGSGLPTPTLDNTDLCYFQLPIHPERAGLSSYFSNSMITAAWEEAFRVIEEILAGNFEEIGDLNSDQMPTLAALCGISGL